MDEGLQGIIVLIIIASACSFITHYFCKWFFFSTLISALLSTFLFQVAVYLHEGQLDKFAIIALVFGGIYSWLISLLVGIPFVMKKIKRYSRKVT